MQKVSRDIAPTGGAARAGRPARPGTRHMHKRRNSRARSTEHGARGTEHGARGTGHGGTEHRARGTRHQAHCTPDAPRSTRHRTLQAPGTPHGEPHEEPGNAKTRNGLGTVVLVHPPRLPPSTTASDPSPIGTAERDDLFVRCPRSLPVRPRRLALRAFGDGFRQTVRDARAFDESRRYAVHGDGGRQRDRQAAREVDQPGLAGRVGDAAARRPKPADRAMLTMRPAPWARRRGANARESRYGPRRLVSCTRFQSRRSTRRRSVNGMPMFHPALLMSMSTRPKSVDDGRD